MRLGISSELPATYRAAALAGAGIVVLGLIWVLPPPPVRAMQLVVAGLVGWMAARLRHRSENREALRTAEVITAPPLILDDETVRVTKRLDVCSSEQEVRKRVLIVDDDPILRRLVSRTLASDFDVLSSDGGEDALEVLASEAVDVILLDFVMPGMNGIDVLREIRARDETRCVPVIMCTARQAGDDVIRAMRMGANDYCVKPFGRADIVERIAVLLDCAQGQRIGDYRLGRLLGKGGMGVVYRARHAYSGQAVALKLMRRGLGECSEFAQRFTRESRLASRVSHPNVVGVEGYGISENGTRYLVMELVEGRCLEELARDGLSVRQVVQVGSALARGLQALENLGILHRDMKPTNVMVTADGEPKILDFGIAKELNEDNGLTKIGVAMGSLAYASPDQLLGELDLCADVYGLGATLYYALAGHRPFMSGTNIDNLLWDKRNAVPRVSDKRDDVPAKLDGLICQMLNPVQPKRPTITEVVSTLDSMVTTAQTGS